MIRLFDHPLAPLVLFAAVLAATLTGYVVVGVIPSTTFELLTSFGWALLVGLWIVSDARRRECTPCFDFGLFCYMFFPVVVPGYCFWSRGWRGLVMLAVIASTWIVPFIIASVVWMVLYA
jgi:hypothetical protein